MPLYRIVAVTLPLAMVVAPAFAQVQQGNPNAANQNMSTMSTNRAIQQDMTSQYNTTTMTIQRNQNAQPPAPPVAAPRGGAPGR